MKIVFATENPGKLKEVQDLARPFGFEVFSPSQAGFEPVVVDERGDTYRENALLKIEAYRKQSAAKDIVLCGEDSGIEINVLNGEPGLHSRRWLGYAMMDQEICCYALGRMHGQNDRSASFKSVLAYCVSGGEVCFAEGTMNGWITETMLTNAPRQEGFPFRRLFMVDAQPNPIPLWEFDTLPLEKRVPSHREQSFLELFRSLRLLADSEGQSAKNVGGMRSAA